MCSPKHIPCKNPMSVSPCSAKTVKVSEIFSFLAGECKHFHVSVCICARVRRAFVCVCVCESMGALASVRVW